MIIFLAKYWKYIAVLMFLITLSVGSYIEGKNRERLYWKAEIATMKEEAAKVALDKYTQDVKRISESAKEFSESSDKIKETAEKLERTRKAYAVKNPLPADCRPDAERVRILKAAIDAANTTD
jgi:hypothetical protein